MRTAIFIFILFITLACEPESEFVVTSSTDIDIVELDTLELQRTKSGNRIVYRFGNQVLDYKIDYLNFQNSELIWNGKSETFALEDSFQIILNGKKLMIYKFIANPFVIDGSTYHFFTKDHGLLMYKSTTWRSFTAIEHWSPYILQQLTSSSPEST